MRSAKSGNRKSSLPALVAAALLALSLLPLPAQAGMLDFLAPFTPPGAFPASASPQSVARMNAIKVYNSGVHELKNKNLKGAAECFQQALIFDPSMKEVHGALGQVLYDSGCYEDSFKEMQQAATLNPNDASAWCMLALASCHIQRYDVTVDAFQNYLKLKPHGGYADEARRSVLILQHTVFGNPQSEDRTGNYFGDFPTTNLRKWNSNMLPLRVFIADGTGTPGYTQTMQNALRQSFNDWTVISDGRIQFALVDNPSNAQIVCTWTANKLDLGGSEELGITHSTWRANGNIQHADIVFLTIYEAAPRLQDTERRAKAVYLHEIGHALGLSHSQEPWDIMYPLVAPSGLEFPLTLRDKNTLLALYNNDPTGLIAKRFDAAIAPGRGPNGGMNGGMNGGINGGMNGGMNGGFNTGSQSGWQMPNTVASGALPVPSGFNAFAQSPTDTAAPSSFSVPPGMPAPQMPATTAYAPANPQSAFSSANIPGNHGPGLSRNELNNNRAVPPPPPPQTYSPPPPNMTPTYSGGPSFGTPSMEQLSALNRAAAQATARRDFDEAINKLQDAHRLAPSDQIICRNLGLAFGNAANVAVQSGDFTKALNYYKNALEVLKTNADRSAYDSILADYQDMVKRQSGRN